jgi:uncharacterized DUF497 family protein
VPGFQFQFEWDPQKAFANLVKHGVAFPQASSVFLDPLAATVADEEHSEGERRWVTLGLAGSGLLLVVIHTYEEVEPGSASLPHHLRPSRNACRDERL